MSTNPKPNGLTKNYSLVGCNFGPMKIRNSVGTAQEDKIIKKVALPNLAFVEKKGFSRKALLKDKIGSMKEEKSNKTRFYVDFMKKKPIESTVKRQDSIRFRRKTSIVARSKGSNFQYTSGKVSIDSLNELTKSDFVNELLDKPVTNPDLQSLKIDSKISHKTVTLSNLFTCLNTDKTLKDTRLNLRVNL